MKPRVVRVNDVVTKTAPDDMFIGQVFQDQIFVPEDPSKLRIRAQDTFLTLSSSFSLCQQAAWCSSLINSSGGMPFLHF